MGIKCDDICPNCKFADFTNDRCTFDNASYEKGRADGIEKCIEEVIPTLYEFDVEQEVIDYVQKWLENLKEQKCTMQK